MFLFLYTARSNTIYMKQPVRMLLSIFEDILVLYDHLFLAITWLLLVVHIVHLLCVDQARELVAVYLEKSTFLPEPP